MIQTPSQLVHGGTQDDEAPLQATGAQMENESRQCRPEHLTICPETLPPTDPDHKRHCACRPHRRQHQQQQRDRCHCERLRLTSITLSQDLSDKLSQFLCRKKTSIYSTFNPQPDPIDPSTRLPVSTKETTVTIWPAITMQSIHFGAPSGPCRHATSSVEYRKDHHLLNPLQRILSPSCKHHPHPQHRSEERSCRERV